MKTVNKTRLTVLLLCYALVHIVFHPGQPFLKFKGLTVSRYTVDKATTPAKKPLLAINFRRGVEENQHNNYKSFAGTSYPITHADKDLYASHSYNVNYCIPGNTLLYSPGSPRSPPVC